MTTIDYAREWDALADEQDANTAPGRARAETYRRTAESLRLEEQTGEGHCVCCLKPFRLHRHGHSGASS